MKHHARHWFYLLVMLCENAAAQSSVPADSTATTPAPADSARGERTIVVADMETHTPVRQVLVFLPNRESVRTNYRGEFVLRTDSFELLRLRHPKYHELRVTPAELAREDTLLLLPREHSVGEVVVYGHNKTDQAKLNAFHNQLQNGMVEELRARAKKPGVNFDFGELTDFKGRARRKRAERIKRSLEKY